MQYILDENEMRSFQTDRDALIEMVKTLPSKKTLQTMCTKIANEWPTFKGWDGTDEPSPWDCILSVDYEHCCDGCPVWTICPNQNKSWSK